MMIIIFNIIYLPTEWTRVDTIAIITVSIKYKVDIFIDYKLRQLINT